MLNWIENCGIENRGILKLKNLRLKIKIVNEIDPRWKIVCFNNTIASFWLMHFKLQVLDL